MPVVRVCHAGQFYVPVAKGRFLCNGRINATAVIVQQIEGRWVIVQDCNEPGNILIYSPPLKTLNQALLELELKMITDALFMSGNVRSRAARILNISRTTLIEKMRKHGILESMPSSAAASNQFMKRKEKVDVTL